MESFFFALRSQFQLGSHYDDVIHWKKIQINLITISWYNQRSKNIHYNNPNSLNELFILTYLFPRKYSHYCFDRQELVFFPLFDAYILYSDSNI